jgi:hypothetical protein
MSAPVILARMEQSRQSASRCIQARKIRPLAEVAAMAGESKIRWRVVPAMLSGDNVFYMKKNRWLVVAMQLAIFTSVTRSFDHDPA